MLRSARRLTSRTRRGRQPPQATRQDPPARQSAKRVQADPLPSLDRPVNAAAFKIHVLQKFRLIQILCPLSLWNDHAFTTYERIGRVRRRTPQRNAAAPAPPPAREAEATPSQPHRPLLPPRPRIHLSLLTEASPPHPNPLSGSPTCSRFRSSSLYLAPSAPPSPSPSQLYLMMLRLVMGRCETLARPTRLLIDALELAVSAILEQPDRDDAGAFHPVALTQPEHLYSPHLLELLGVMHALRLCGPSSSTNCTPTMPACNVAARAAPRQSSSGAVAQPAGRVPVPRRAHPGLCLCGRLLHPEALPRWRGPGAAHGLRRAGFGV